MSSHLRTDAFKTKMFSPLALTLPFSHFPENLFLSALSALLVLLYVTWISDVKMLRSLCLENQDQVWKASLTIHLSA